MKKHHTTRKVNKNNSPMKIQNQAINPKQLRQLKEFTNYKTTTTVVG